MSQQRDEWAEGYSDGRDTNAPHPNDNRSPEYRHSFDVGRREVEGRPLSAAAYRVRVKLIEGLVAP
jgi:hypothetical protein